MKRKPVFKVEDIFDTAFSPALVSYSLFCTHMIGTVIMHFLWSVIYPKFWWNRISLHNSRLVLFELVISDRDPFIILLCPVLSSCCQTNDATLVLKISAQWASVIVSSKVKVMSRILGRGACRSFFVILLLSLSYTDYWKRLLEHASWLPLFVFVFFSRLSFVFFVFVSPTWWEEVAGLVVATWGDRAQGEILAEGHRHAGGGCLSISIIN